jgi:pimeloyl-ACP methyl ester carboxylesterase
MWQRLVLGTVAAILLGAAGLYLVEIRRAYARIAEGSEVIDSRFGLIEYASGGDGPPVLVVHGSGGGFDQGALIAGAVLGPGYRWIAPSRFGYLRSALPDGANWDDQAHAFAALLDSLGIRQVAVVAMSQGGASALLFATLYPERVSSLTLLSCGVAAAESESQAEADRKGRMLTALYRYDLPYWLASRLLRRPFMRLIGADEAALSTMAPDELKLVHGFIDAMNPASQRRHGVAFDNRAALPGPRISAIAAPTLIIHARDDSLQLYRNAEFAAATIPNTRLLSYARGGHLLIATEQRQIRDAVQQHIAAGNGGVRR